MFDRIWLYITEACNLRCQENLLSGSPVFSMVKLPFGGLLSRINDKKFSETVCTLSDASNSMDIPDPSFVIALFNGDVVKE